MSRRGARSRVTKETRVEIELDLDGPGEATVATGIPFFDHMLGQLGKHGGIWLRVSADGDVDVDTHHTVEDTGIALGEALRDALGDKAGIRRYGSIALPLDEALIEVALDISGRPFLVYEVETLPDTLPLGQPAFDPQLGEEFWRAFVQSSGVTLHIRQRAGKNTHHILEASFKGVARALRDAVRIEGSDVPSTKGTLSA